MSQMLHNGNLRRIFLILGLLGFVGFGVIRASLPEALWAGFPLLTSMSHPLVGLAAFLLVASILLLIAAYFLPDGKQDGRG